MAEGLSVALPLRVDPVDGAYGLNKRITQVASQNLKMIILTSPGERIMNPEFGVGVRRYLFENNTGGTLETIKTRIRSQVATYLPYINILQLDVSSPPIPGGLPGDIDETRVNITIKYSVPSANVVSDLTIPLSL
tara:strand:- start:1533 stop:1937 length:405 start_codon:yes stop_codon:yes gene_type:complete